jgi:SAM-dependent methyltransferase
MGRWSRLAAPLLLDFAGVPDQGAVLDVGSGTGSLAFEIAERRPRVRVRGIDPSAEYVAAASNRNRFGERVSFEVGDARRLRFADGAFDASLSFFVINFIPDVEQALAEIRRAAKPGGVVSAATWDYGGGMRMLRAFWDAAVAVKPDAEKRDERNMSLCAEGELARLWTKVGLEDVREQALSIAMNFASFADYWDPFLLGQGPAGAYVRTLDEKEREALRREVKDRLGVRDEDAPFELPARAWAVRGVAPSKGAL